MPSPPIPPPPRLPPPPSGPLESTAHLSLVQIEGERWVVGRSIMTGGGGGTESQLRVLVLPASAVAAGNTSLLYSLAEEIFAAQRLAQIKRARTADCLRMMRRTLYAHGARLSRAFRDSLAFGGADAVIWPWNSA